jgi:quinoprotein glucose dehydrogenase
MVPAKTNAKPGSAPALYAQLCMSCHGVNREGNAAQNIPALGAVAQRLKAADILSLFATGKGVMPSFGFLPEDQKRALADFILGASAEPSVGDTAAGKVEPGGSGAPARSPYATTGYNRFLDPEGYPALRPPWGTINALDLNTGEYLWKKPLGEFAALTARGIAPTGTENYGGPVVTASGLLFIAATKDEKFRAFDAKTGEKLWETTLPAGGYATPTTYSVAGRQFVVVACGGGKMGTKSGDAYVAFALPE